MELPVLTNHQLIEARADDFVRLVTLMTKYSHWNDAERLAIEHFPAAYPRSLNLRLFEKAAVNPGTTLDATWAGPLSPLRPLPEAFIELVRPATLLGRIPGLRRVPLQSSLPAQTAGTSFGWVGEGAPTPATKADFATATLPRAKVGGLVGLSKELTTISTLAAIRFMRAELIEGCKRFLDSQFIDPAVAAVANVSPASITNGTTPIVSAGTSQANAATDIQALLTQFFAGNPDVEHAVLLMKPANAVALARATGSQTLGLNGGTLFGIPVVTSATVGDRLIALDASQILYADDDDMTVDVSENASVQMDSAPTDPTVAATVFVSFWQRNLVGVKLTRFVNWARVATTAVKYVSGAAYV